MALAVFAVTELRANEPVLPPRLFRNRVFVTSIGVGAVVGFAMFGSVTYMPACLQVVTGASPTGSGLQMVPRALGMLVTSVISGQMISRYGRYKKFPVEGTVTVSSALFRLSRMATTATRMTASAFLALL